MKGVLQWLEKDDSLSVVRDKKGKTQPAFAPALDSGCGLESEDSECSHTQERNMVPSVEDAISLPIGLKGPVAEEMLTASTQEPEAPVRQQVLDEESATAQMMPRLQLAGSRTPRSGSVSIAPASRSSGSQCAVEFQCKDGLPCVVSPKTQEETAWTARLRSTGAVSRLVAYTHGDKPVLDFKFRGGEGEPVVVEVVRERSRAAQCGVRQGDRLASIDGTKEFMALPADQVRSLLRAPTTLVFLGFVGQQRAEVQLNANSGVCGFSAKENVFNRMPDAFIVCEETVFEPGSASLFFTTQLSDAEKIRTVQPTRARRRTAPASVEAAQTKWSPIIAAFQEKTLEAVTPLFELRREEAHQIVHQALLPEPVCATRRANFVHKLSKLEAHDILHRALDPGKAAPSFGSNFEVADALPWHAAKRGQCTVSEQPLTRENVVGVPVNAGISASAVEHGGLTASRGRFQI